MKTTTQHLRARQWLVLLLGSVAVLALLRVESAFSQDQARTEARFAELRKDPQRFAQLTADAKKFFALPEARQKAMRKLDADLHQLHPGERERLIDAMKHYSEWLEALPEADRQAVRAAPNGPARLAKIKVLKEHEWIGKQPKTVQQQLAPALQAAGTIGLIVGAGRNPPNAVAAATLVARHTDWRGAMIKHLKREESQRRQQWLIAGNFWEELREGKRPLPTRAAEFSPEVELFVKEYLKPRLSKGEWDRLVKAEGDWPKYPITLVELADKHPLALPSPHAPTKSNDLPKSIHEALLKSQFDTKKIGKPSLDAFLLNKNTLSPILMRLEHLGEKKPSLELKFNCSAATYARFKGVKIPYEMWPTRPSEMAGPMQLFLDPKGPFFHSLTEGERLELEREEKEWPEYPLKVKQLADKYGFKPPWQVLPHSGDLRSTWEKYRVKPPAKAAGLEPPAIFAHTADAWTGPSPGGELRWQPAAAQTKVAD